MIILIFTFVLMLLLSLSIVLVVTAPSQEVKNVQQRMVDIRTRRRSLPGEPEELDLRAEAPVTLSHLLTRELHRFGVAARLERLLIQSGSRLESGSFVLTSFALAAGFALLCLCFIAQLLPCSAAFLLGFSLPMCWLQRLRTQRLSAFERQLPEAIDLMARALRTGHSIQQTLELVAEQTRAPLGEEFNQVQQQQRFGRPFREALLEMGDRVPSSDLHFVITAMLVQKETGGDLIEILERTTEVIRERLRVAGEIRVYTAQGRLTGWILALLPVLMLTAISLISPAYAAVLFHDPLGLKLLIGGSLMILVGGLIIRRIVDVEV